jgi:hypothetical protein
LLGASKYDPAPVYQWILVGRQKETTVMGPGRRGPCAVKVARTVTTGGMGKHSAAVRPVPTHYSLSMMQEQEYGVSYLRQPSHPHQLCFTPLKQKE